MSAARVLVADDHALVRDSLKLLLESQGFVVVAEAADGAEAVRLAVETQPDVALLDLAMPALNGIEATRQIRQVSPSTRTVVLTMHHEDQYVLEARRAGAAGYVLKTRAAAVLVEAIRSAQHGGSSHSAAGARSAATTSTEPQPLVDRLSPRERQVLLLIAEGRSTREIAALLGLSVKTVESHRTRIGQKLKLQSTAELVRYAIRCGLVQA
jgi:DNA-binding NarL/FixJ family response regulator